MMNRTLSEFVSVWLWVGMACECHPLLTGHGYIVSYVNNPPHSLMVARQ